MENRVSIAPSDPMSYVLCIALEWCLGSGCLLLLSCPTVASLIFNGLPTDFQLMKLPKDIVKMKSAVPWPRLPSFQSSTPLQPSILTSLISHMVKQVNMDQF